MQFDHDALAAATAEQRRKAARLRSHFSIRGMVLRDNGDLQVGYERTRDGRDMERVFAPDGRMTHDFPTYL